MSARLKPQAGAHLHVVLDDAGNRHVVRSGPRGGKKSKAGMTEVISGEYEAVQRVGDREWRVPVPAFWQSHRDAAATYSALVAHWAGGPGAADPPTTAWDLYGGAGVFAAALAVVALGTCVLLLPEAAAVTRMRRRCRSKLSFSVTDRVNLVEGDHL